MTSPSIRRTNEANQLHCEDGPAVVWPNGDEYYYINGMLHREDGPAVVRANGTKYWALNGIYCTEKEFEEKIKREYPVSPLAIDIKNIKPGDKIVLGKNTSKIFSGIPFEVACVDASKIYMFVGGKVDEEIVNYVTKEHKLIIKGLLDRKHIGRAVVWAFSSQVVSHISEGEDASPEGEKVENEKGMIRRDLEKVAYRQSCKKISAATRLAATAFLVKAFKLDAEEEKTINYMVNSPCGDAILSYALGLGLEKVPIKEQGPIVQNMAEHFRVHGLDVAADEGLDLLWHKAIKDLVPFFKRIVAIAKQAKEGEYLDAAQELADLDIPDLRVVLEDDEVEPPRKAVIDPPQFEPDEEEQFDEQLAFVS